MLKLSKVDPKTIRAVVEYNAARYFNGTRLDYKIDTIATKYSAYPLGAGMGCGVRDLEYDGFRSRRGIKAFAKQVKALRCKVILMEEPTDNEVQINA